jgi:hypothetical protein
MTEPYEARFNMTTNHSVPDPLSSLEQQRQPRGLRRSITRLPVTTRLPKEHAVIEPTRPLPTNPNLRHVPKSDTTSSRTVTNSRLPSRNATPSVVQARPPSATPSVQSSSSMAQSIGRRAVRPGLSTKTPSLVSGSTISAPDSPHSALRRKPSTIDQYALRVKTDPESMQEHRDLLKTAHRVQYDDDPFPEAILGMTLPPTSGLAILKSVSRRPNLDFKQTNSRPDTKVTRPVVDMHAPFSDASSRNSDSPFSHQSTPTSASSHSSLATSTLGSTRHRDSLDLARAATKAHAKKDKPTTASISSSLRQEAGKPTPLKGEIKHEQEPPRQGPLFSNPFSTKATPVQAQKSSAAVKPTIRNTSRRGLVDGIAPEFAHLNIDPPRSQSTSRLVPPRRPSRDGIDGLGLSLDIPVVQSNLSHITRVSSRGSSEAGLESPPLSPRRTFGFAHRTSSRQSNKSQTHPTAPRTPVERSDMGTPLSRKDSPMVGSSPNTVRSPSVSMPSNLHAKSASPPIVPERPKRGPSAGTGHEGYGKFGFRGRGSSIFGRTSRSSSKDSSTSRSGLSFLSRKKSIADEGEDGLDQFLEERREPIVLRGNGNGSKLDEPETTRKPKSEHADEIVYRSDSSATKAVTPTSSAKKPSLSELGREGKEGHWLNSPTTNKSPTFLQRFKSKISSQSLDNESGDQQAPSPLQFGSIDQATNVDLADIEKLLSGDNRSSQSSKSSDIDPKNTGLPISYDRRHEGLLPSPLETRSLKRTSLSSPVLLQAKTMTQVKAPQPVEISKTTGSSYQEDTPKARLRSVGRIPQVVRVGQVSQAQPAQQSATAIRDPSSHDLDGKRAVPIADETQEFIAFPPRKDSELSYTSSSGLGSPYITRSSFVGEDEVWNEYDNLLDEISSPKVRASTTSSFGAAFQYGDMLDHRTVIRNEGNTPRSISDPEATKRVSNFDTSRPSTTFSISDYLLDQDATSEAPASPQKARYLQVAPALPSPRIPRKPLPRKRPADNPASAELRFAALMTSKWLSFGRLLFSPAHEEAMTGDHTRILIVDGLGKEWSYNCALTYPKCQFYNLGPEPNSSSWETLSNYHHVTHPSISTPFPFPNNYFSAVVFRFPVADADDAYQVCFNEIKRTMRPSGYLEISVLDLDLVNMGHTARKTIRDLKIRMHQQDSQISLWNHGDAFLTHLGKRHFGNLRKCVVGIPVAGRIRRSHDSGSSSSGSQRKRTSEQPEPEYLRFTEWMRSSGNKNNEEDERHERRNDEDITKTVAKIGRWWYSSCYPDPDQSTTGPIWDTPDLLRECERQRTSFRLLFCYAQKPACVKRRTASV